MTYTAPSKQQLLKATRDLQQVFNGFAKLYFPPDYKTLRGLIEKLEDDYKVEVINKGSTWRFTTPTPDPTRLDQIACITTLSLHLPESPGDTEKVTEEEEAKLNQAYMILLGASFYRFLRIESSYTGGITGGMGMFGSADNSALKIVLAKLLNFTKDNVLDSQTIASCCKEYRSYLKQNGNSDRYSYIKKSTDFFDNLNAIITDAEIKSKPINDKVQYIMFVKSVPALLNNYDKLFTDTIFQQLRLAEKLKEKSPLDYSDVQSAMKELNLDSTLNDFFEHHFLTEDLVITTETLDDFKEDINAKMQILYQYALLGAYVMCIEKCKPLMSDEPPSALCKALQFSIGTKVENPLDNKSKHLALSALKQLVELSGESPLNYGVWGGPGLFKAELIRQLEATQNQPEESEKIVFSL